MSDILAPELLLLLKTLAFSPEQLQQQKSKNKPPKPAFDQLESTILRKAVQLKQSQYSTTISQDQERLVTLNQPALERAARRQKMAIQVRIGEKEILANLSAMLNGNDGSAKRSANGDTERKAKAQKT